MPRGKRKTTETTVTAYTHEGKKRKNNPPVGLVSTATDKLNGRTKYEHDPHMDPTLSWAGRKEGTSYDVQNVCKMKNHNILCKIFSYEILDKRDFGSAYRIRTGDLCLERAAS